MSTWTLQLAKGCPKSLIISRQRVQRCVTHEVLMTVEKEEEVLYRGGEGEEGGGISRNGEGRERKECRGRRQNIKR